MKYNVIDAQGEVVNQEPFDSESEACQARDDYRQHWREMGIQLPLRVEARISQQTRALAEDTFARIERGTR
jgi:hypothetical protein